MAFSIASCNQSAPPIKQDTFIYKQDIDSCNRQPNLKQCVIACTKTDYEWCK